MTRRRSVGAGTSAAGMVGLALALGCSNAKQPVALKNPLADSADQVLYHTKSVLTDAGVMKAEVYGDTAYVFDDNTRVEMRGVRTIFFTVTGERNAVLTSREGTYNTRTNNMQARGDVIVVSQDGRRLTTPVLTYEQTKNQISSDTSFTLTDTARQMIGIGFRSDPNMNNMRCLRACSGSAGRVTLPGGSADTGRAASPIGSPATATPRAPSAGAAPSTTPSVGAGAAQTPGASARAAATGRATGTLPRGMPPSAGGAHPAPAATSPNQPKP